MALFNNIGSLMGMLMQPNQNQESKQLADRAGVDTSDFAKIASIGLPLLLQGINKNNQSSSGLESFNQALTQHQTRNSYDNLNQFTQNVDTEDGDKIVGHVFSGQKDSISTSLADRLGVSPDTVKRTLAVLAPIALKYLADKKRDNNLDAQGVQQETQNITREAAQQVRSINRDDQKDYGLLGGLLGFGDDKKPNEEKDHGLLGDIMDFFK